MIESVRIQNFKNFRDATLELGPLTVIVGTNASGKSNLRDAFRFLHGIGRGYSLADIIGGKYGEGGELQWNGIRGGVRGFAFAGESDVSFTTSLGLGLGALDRKVFNHEIALKVWEKGSVVLKRESMMENEAQADFHSETINLVPSLIFRYPEEQPNDMPSDDHPFYPEFSMTSQITNALFFQHQLHSMRFFDVDPEAMKIPSLPGQTVLGDRGENLSSVLKAIYDDPALKSALVDWVRELTPVDVVDFEFNEDQSGKILLSLVEENGQRTSAASASDGTLRFLGILAALLGPKTAKFYFFEELETGIHPTRLHLLLQLIEQQVKAGKTQVVITTHSSQLLGMLSEESREHASLVYRLEGSSEGHVKRIMDIPSAKEVLEKQNLSRLHVSGWLEDAVAFSDEEAKA